MFVKLNMIDDLDMEYWGIDQYTLDPCCALKYFPQLETGQNEKDEDLDAKKKVLEVSEEEDFGSSNVGILRAWLWNTLEYPWKSNVRRIWHKQGLVEGVKLCLNLYFFGWLEK